MSEVTAAVESAPSFQFAFKGPGLSVSVSSSDPNALAQYAALTFGFGAPPAGEVSESPFTSDRNPAPNPTPQAEAPKQTRTRSKKDEPAAVAPPPPAEPAAAPAEPAAAPVSIPTGAMTKDQLTEKTVEAFGKDRTKVAALMADFDCKRFSELKEEQYGAYGDKLMKLLAELGGKA